MSRPLTDLETRLLLHDLSRRTDLLALLRRSPHSFSWHGTAIGVVIFFAMVALLNLFSLGQAVVLIVLIFAFGGLVEIHTQTVHRRVDALIKLLRQEGLLDSTLPASAEKRSDA